MVVTIHEVVNISQSPPKIISARCYCVQSLTQYYFGFDQVQSEGKACPYMPYTSPSLGLNLRSYLEGKTDLTLPQLRRILGAHFSERDATELYTELSNAVQHSSGSVQNL